MVGPGGGEIGSRDEQQGIQLGTTQDNDAPMEPVSVSSSHEINLEPPTSHSIGHGTQGRKHGEWAMSAKMILLRLRLTS
eukprot:CAMPEP_0184686920 /NCGR_PEP_ID=MMETSP0312-20130426/24632_1 /TAXON_ID=31354 /ORGANISM="Compsopogon coeruleus, Strain SAG 36.94" /LENGTH=78 /DNA_ID=CAMNT_0027142541 /DNA_START=126 /DNA_END=363 /DNA_ORIENTATION=-